MKVQVPKELVGDKSNMHDSFIHCASKMGDSKAYAIELLRLLPLDLRQASVWQDKLTSLWRYQYGMPFDRMPEDTIITGTNVHFPVCELYSAMRIADKHLKREQLLEFIERLSNKEKHCDVLFEMRPPKDLKKKLKIFYEVSGKGIGNTTCDWLVKGNLINILFDVKNRSKSLINHMKQLIPEINKGTQNILPTAPNPEDLFRSVESKLRKRCWLLQLQGVWIHLDIKEHEDKLTLYFNKTLNKKKIHFAIISDWKEDAFILARNGIIKAVLKRVFRLTESKRFVTREYA